ncbi:hypothetical protein RIF29_28813 [Crotalaria pallida]|uniref:Uncharacterized protein n=1 Tax=Crotalaria pallida TaxID=3830 RepID=A0AAN9EDG6_CROPI
MARKRGKQNLPSPSPKTPSSSHDPKSNEKPVLSNTSPQGTTDLYDELHDVIKSCGAKSREIPKSHGVNSRVEFQHDALHEAVNASTPLGTHEDATHQGIRVGASSLGPIGGSSKSCEDHVIHANDIDLELLEDHDSEFESLFKSIE